MEPTRDDTNSSSHPQKQRRWRPWGRQRVEESEDGGEEDAEIMTPQQEQELLVQQKIANAMLCNSFSNLVCQPRNGNESDDEGEDLALNKLSDWLGCDYAKVQEVALSPKSPVPVKTILSEDNDDDDVDKKMEHAFSKVLTPSASEEEDMDQKRLDQTFEKGLERPSQSTLENRDLRASDRILSPASNVEVVPPPEIPTLPSLDSTDTVEEQMENAFAQVLTPSTSEEEERDQKRLDKAFDKGLSESSRESEANKDAEREEESPLTPLTLQQIPSVDVPGQCCGLTLALNEDRTQSQVETYETTAEVPTGAPTTQPPEPENENRIVVNDLILSSNNAEEDVARSMIESSTPTQDLREEVEEVGNKQNNDIVLVVGDATAGDILPTNAGAETEENESQDSERSIHENSMNGEILNSENVDDEIHGEVSTAETVVEDAAVQQPSTDVSGDNLNVVEATASSASRGNLQDLSCADFCDQDDDEKLSKGAVADSAAISEEEAKSIDSPRFLVVESEANKDLEREEESPFTPLTLQQIPSVDVPGQCCGLTLALNEEQTQSQVETCETTAVVPTGAPMTQPPEPENENGIVVNDLILSSNNAEEDVARSMIESSTPTQDLYEEVEDTTQDLDDEVEEVGNKQNNDTILVAGSCDILPIEAGAEIEENQNYDSERSSHESSINRGILNSENMDDEIHVEVSTGETVVEDSAVQQPSTYVSGEDPNVVEATASSASRENLQDVSCAGFRDQDDEVLSKGAVVDSAAISEEEARSIGARESDRSVHVIDKLSICESDANKEPDNPLSGDICDAHNIWPPTDDTIDRSCVESECVVRSDRESTVENAGNTDIESQAAEAEDVRQNEVDFASSADIVMPAMDQSSGMDGAVEHEKECSSEQIGSDSHASQANEIVGPSMFQPLCLTQDGDNAGPPLDTAAFVASSTVSERQFEFDSATKVLSEPCSESNIEQEQPEMANRDVVEMSAATEEIGEQDSNEYPVEASNNEYAPLGKEPLEDDAKSLVYDNTVAGESLANMPFNEFALESEDNDQVAENSPKATTNDETPVCRDAVDDEAVEHLDATEDPTSGSDQVASVEDLETNIETTHFASKDQGDSHDIDTSPPATALDETVIDRYLVDEESKADDLEDLKAANESDLVGPPVDSIDCDGALGKGSGPSEGSNNSMMKSRCDDQGDEEPLVVASSAVGYAPDAESEAVDKGVLGGVESLVAVAEDMGTIAPVDRSVIKLEEDISPDDCVGTTAAKDHNPDGNEKPTNDANTSIEVESEPVEIGDTSLPEEDPVVIHKQNDEHNPSDNILVDTKMESCDVVNGNDETLSYLPVENGYGSNVEDINLSVQERAVAAKLETMEVANDSTTDRQRIYSATTIQQAWRLSLWARRDRSIRAIQSQWRLYCSKEAAKRMAVERSLSASTIQKTWRLHAWTQKDRRIRVIQRQWRFHRLASQLNSSIKIQRSYRSYRLVQSAKQTVNSRRILVHRSAGIIRNAWIRHKTTVRSTVAIQRCWRSHYQRVMDYHAVRIQKTWRMKNAVLQLCELRQQEMAARLIQKSWVNHKRDRCIRAIQGLWRLYCSKEDAKRMAVQRRLSATTIQKTWRLYAWTQSDRRTRVIQRQWRLYRLASLRKSSVKIQRSYRSYRLVQSAKQTVNSRRILVHRSAGIIRNAWIRHKTTVRSTVAIQRCWRSYYQRVMEYHAVRIQKTWRMKNEVLQLCDLRQQEMSARLIQKSWANHRQSVQNDSDVLVDRSIFESESGDESKVASPVPTTAEDLVLESMAVKEDPIADGNSGLRVAEQPLLESESDVHQDEESFPIKEEANREMVDRLAPHNNADKEIERENDEPSCNRRTLSDEDLAKMKSEPIDNVPPKETLHHDSPKTTRKTAPDSYTIENVSRPKVAHCDSDETGTNVSSSHSPITLSNGKSSELIARISTEAAACFNISNVNDPSLSSNTGKDHDESHSSISELSHGQDVTETKTDAKDAWVSMWAAVKTKKSKPKSQITTSELDIPVKSTLKCGKDVDIQLSEGSRTDVPSVKDSFEASQSSVTSSPSLPVSQNEFVSVWKSVDQTRTTSTTPSEHSSVKAASAPSASSPNNNFDPSAVEMVTSKDCATEHSTVDHIVGEGSESSQMSTSSNRRDNVAKKEFVSLWDKVEKVRSTCHSNEEVSSVPSREGSVFNTIAEPITIEASSSSVEASIEREHTDGASSKCQSENSNAIWSTQAEVRDAPKRTRSSPKPTRPITVPAAFARAIERQTSNMFKPVAIAKTAGTASLSPKPDVTEDANNTSPSSSGQESPVTQMSTLRRKTRKKPSWKTKISVVRPSQNHAQDGDIMVVPLNDNLHESKTAKDMTAEEKTTQCIKAHQKIEDHHVDVKKSPDQNDVVHQTSIENGAPHHLTKRSVCPDKKGTVHPQCEMAGEGELIGETLQGAAVSNISEELSIAKRTDTNTAEQRQMDVHTSTPSQKSSPTDGCRRNKLKIPSIFSKVNLDRQLPESPVHSPQSSGTIIVSAVDTDKSEITISGETLRANSNVHTTNPVLLPGQRRSFTSKNQSFSISNHQPPDGKTCETHEDKTPNLDQTPLVKPSKLRQLQTARTNSGDGVTLCSTMTKTDAEDKTAQEEMARPRQATADIRDSIATDLASEQNSKSSVVQPPIVKPSDQTPYAHNKWPKLKPVKSSSGEEAVDGAATKDKVMSDETPLVKPSQLRKLRAAKATSSQAVTPSSDMDSGEDITHKATEEFQTTDGKPSIYSLRKTKSPPLKHSVGESSRESAPDPEPTGNGNATIFSPIQLRKTTTDSKKTSETAGNSSQASRDAPPQEKPPESPVQGKQPLFSPGRLRKTKAGGCVSTAKPPMGESDQPELMQKSQPSEETVSKPATKPAPFSPGRLRKTKVSIPAAFQKTVETVASNTEENSQQISPPASTSKAALPKWSPSSVKKAGPSSLARMESPEKDTEEITQSPSAKTSPPKPRRKKLVIPAAFR